MEANTGILSFWAGAVWRACGTARHRRRTDPSPVLLDNAIKRAERQLEQTGYEWANVKGPAGAAVLTARRIGWRFLSGFRLVDERGSVIDMGITDPRNVRTAVERATRTAAAVRAATKEGIERAADGIWMAPILRALASKRLPATAKAALKRSFTGGYWANARRAAQGLCSEADCDRCGDEVDDEHHRIWVCSSVEALRDRYTTEEMRAGAAAAPRNDPRWTRGILPVPSLAVPPPRRDFGEEWYFSPGVPEEKYFDGPVYTDGSAYNPQVPEVRRAGWAVVQVDGDGRLLKAVFGHVPASVSTDQTVAAGELYALRRAAELSVGALTVKTDYQGILDGWRAGEAACTAANRPNAASWRALWRTIEGADPQFVKVKAHRSRQEAAESGDPQALLDWMGNREADRFAKRGAACHANAAGRAAADMFEDELKQSTDVAKWIGIALSQWPRATGRRPRSKTWRRELGQRRRMRRRMAAENQGHHLAHGKDGWHCTTCGRRSCTWAGTRRLALSQCKGHTACRIQPQGNRPAAHILWAAEAERTQTGYLPPDVVWCSRCGAYSSARVYNLARVCRGAPEKSARTRLAAFNTGTHPVLRHRLAPPVRLTDEVLAALARGASRRREAFNLLLRGDPTVDAGMNRNAQTGDDGAHRNYSSGDQRHVGEEDTHTTGFEEVAPHEYHDEADDDVFGHGYALDDDTDTGDRQAKKRRIGIRGSGDEGAPIDIDNGECVPPHGDAITDKGGSGTIEGSFSVAGGGAAYAGNMVDGANADVGEHDGHEREEHKSRRLGGQLTDELDLATKRRRIDHADGQHCAESDAAGSGGADERAVDQVDARTDLKRPYARSEGGDMRARELAAESAAVSTPAIRGNHPATVTCATDVSSNAMAHGDRRHAAYPAAPAPMGDRQQEGRVARAGLFQPIPAAHARDAEAHRPADALGVKRRRLRGKQPPTPFSQCRCTHSASGPAHSLAVDQPESSCSRP